MLLRDIFVTGTLSFNESYLERCDNTNSTPRVQTFVKPRKTVTFFHNDIGIKGHCPTQMHYFTEY